MSFTTEPESPSNPESPECGRSAAEATSQTLNYNDTVGKKRTVYDYSNGFVEGTNSRLKMIKRTMYGRCRKQLLEAKLRYVGKSKNG